MVRRLEAGEDPEKLEEQFGGTDEGEAGDAMFSQLVARVKAARKEPVRDPKLYEMRDFVSD